MKASSKPCLKVVVKPEFPYKDQRAFVILADMTSKRTLATGFYTQKSVELARLHSSAVIGFIAMKSLADIEAEVPPSSQEDFVIFTTGIYQSSKGDKIGQQYKTPSQAIQGGADFIIAGRGVYAFEDPVESAKSYQKEGWEAYLARIESPSL